jgi:UDP-N-acetylmuramate dehydrogenase
VSVRDAAEQLRAELGDRVRRDFPLAPLTTFRIGGSAAIFVEPQSEEDLAAVGRAASAAGTPVAVIGKGSNVLVSDDGFDGIVMRLGRGFRWAARDGAGLTAGGAMPLPALAGVALANELSGLEFGVAIPASVGGSVKMNAGAHGHEISEVVGFVDVYELGAQRLRRIAAADAGFGYRGSALPAGGVVTGVSVRLAEGESPRIRALMDEAREWRRQTQPLAEPNCGSVFKNPPREHAARLVEMAGAKGLREGGASVSTKHANFIIAEDGATATEVVDLIRAVQEHVAARTDVSLETEVHLVGHFDRFPY